MTGELKGVIIGGFIACAIPVVNLIVSLKKWKFEMRLDRLKEKHAKKKILYEKTLEDLLKSFEDDSVSAELNANANIHLPKKALEKFLEYADKEQRSPKDTTAFFFEMTNILQDDLKRIDDEIDSMINQNEF